MRAPNFGEVNFGALAGAVTGSFGGLVAVGLPPAILGRNVTLLFAAPFFTLVSWLICLAVGWFGGGQLGPRMGIWFRSPRAELIGGVVAGLIPIAIIIFWSWYMITRAAPPDQSPA